MTENIQYLSVRTYGRDRSVFHNGTLLLTDRFDSCVSFSIFLNLIYSQYN